MDSDAVATSVLHGTNVQDFCARGCQFQHFFERHQFDWMCARNDTRIRGEHTVDVGINFADIRAECGRQSDCRGIAAAAPKSRDVFGVPIESLKSRDDGNRTVVESLTNSIRGHVNDARGSVLGGGHHARLASRVGTRLVTEALDRHSQESHRNSLAGRKKHVEFPRVGSFRDLVSQIDQFVGRVPHR